MNKEKYHYILGTLVRQLLFALCQVVNFFFSVLISLTEHVLNAYFYILFTSIKQQR